MNRITNALLWATAMIGIALAFAAGAIDGEKAGLFLFLIPALYLATNGDAKCRNPFRRWQA
ncbi:MAG: hypothetical protein WBA68_00370 [Alteraurantiacibacter sp.]